MDKDKQPGISFDGIILVEERFWRDFEVPDDSTVNFNVEVSNNRNEAGFNVQIKSTLSQTYNDKQVLSVENTFVGFFSVIEGEENMKIEDFIKYNAVSIMMPYIREHISTITMKSGIKPIYLAPINVYALYNE